MSFCIPVRDQRNQFICGAGQRVLLIEWDGDNTMATTKRVLGEINDKNQRLNTGKCDNRGRLMTGTMLNEDNNNGNCMDKNRRNGSLLRLDGGNNGRRGLEEMRTKMGLSNGIAWNRDQTKMYHVDSCDLTVRQFDYDQNSGDLCKLSLPFIDYKISFNIF